MKPFLFFNLQTAQQNGWNRHQSIRFGATERFTPVDGFFWWDLRWRGSKKNFKWCFGVKTSLWFKNLKYWIFFQYKCLQNDLKVRGAEEVTIGLKRMRALSKLKPHLYANIDAFLTDINSLAHSYMTQVRGKLMFILLYSTNLYTTVLHSISFLIKYVHQKTIICSSNRRSGYIWNS